MGRRLLTVFDWQVDDRFAGLGGDRSVADEERCRQWIRESAVWEFRHYCASRLVLHDARVARHPRFLRDILRRVPVRHHRTVPRAMPNPRILQGPDGRLAWHLRFVNRIANPGTDTRNVRHCQTEDALNLLISLMTRRNGLQNQAPASADRAPDGGQAGSKPPPPRLGVGPSNNPERRAGAATR